MLRVLVSTEGDAFAGHGEQECARLLRLVADRVEDGQLDGQLMDINGNHCGGFDLRLEALQGGVVDE
jgi:hypothetical protein